MAKRRLVLDHSMVSYKCLMLFFLINIPLCSGSCQSGLPNHIIAGKYSTWKLCIVNTYKETLRFKIKSLFSAKDNSTGWLNIGFPQASQKTDYIPFFLLEVSPPNSIVIKVCLCENLILSLY